MLTKQTKEECKKGQYAKKTEKKLVYIINKQIKGKKKTTQIAKKDRKQHKYYGEFLK